MSNTHDDSAQEQEQAQPRRNPAFGRLVARNVSHAVELLELGFASQTAAREATAIDEAAGAPREPGAEAPKAKPRRM